MSAAAATLGDAVLAINAGSSSIKFGLYRAGGTAGPELFARGLLDLGDAPRLTVKAADGTVLEDRPLAAGMSQDAAFAILMDWIDGQISGGALVAVGHRLVHGGRDFSGPALLTADAIAKVEALTPLAPLHQPRSLVPIRVLARLRPELPQIGSFDTAFHRTIEATVSRIALPRDYEAEGVRRYGFHGLSYEYIAGQLEKLGAKSRTVVAHLGNGASLCALRDGKSADTTMGFSALDGLVMGTRTGSIDPGVLLYLLLQKGMAPDDVRRLLYEKSGLLGVSGVSGDMRTLLASSDPRAAEAVDLYAFRASREVAAMTNTLGGLDRLVFTGGVGERAAQVRAAICERLDWLGARLDAAANATHAAVISTPDSTIDVRIIPTDEEIVIARQALALVRGATAA